MRWYQMILSSFLFFYINIMPAVISSLSFNYERSRMLGSGRRHIPSFANFLNRDAFPEPLPQRKPKEAPVPAPFHSLYQGRRKLDDMRVFRERFNLDGLPVGQQISVKGNFDCALTFLAVETQSNIPIVLRGGVGYTYFNIIVKAKPYDAASGQVRAFCARNERYYRERHTPPNIARLYVFPETTKM